MSLESNFSSGAGFSAATISLAIRTLIAVFAWLWLGWIALSSLQLYKQSSAFTEVHLLRQIGIAAVITITVTLIAII